MGNLFAGVPLTEKPEEDPGAWAWLKRKTFEQIGTAGIFSGGPLMDVLDVALIPAYGITGAARGMLTAGREAREGGPPRWDQPEVELVPAFKAIPGGAWEGIKERASFFDVIADEDPEFVRKHPWLALGLGTAADIAVLRPSAALTTPALRLAGRGARAAALGRPVAGARRAATLAESLQRPTVGGAVGLAERAAPIRGALAPRRQLAGEWLMGRDILREGRARELVRRGEILRGRERTAGEVATEAEALAGAPVAPLPLGKWRPGAPVAVLRAEERRWRGVIAQHDRRVGRANRQVDTLVRTRSRAEAHRSAADALTKQREALTPPIKPAPFRPGQWGYTNAKPAAGGFDPTKPWRRVQVLGWGPRGYRVWDPERAGLVGGARGLRPWQLSRDAKGPILPPAQRRAAQAIYRRQRASLSQRMGREESAAQELGSFAEERLPRARVGLAKAEYRREQLTARLLQARGELERVKAKILREGPLPRERRGIAADLPARLDPKVGWQGTGEELSGAHVQTLAAAWAESLSPSGLARTPLEARREILDLVRVLGIDSRRFQRMAQKVKRVAGAHRERLIRVGAITRQEAERMEASGGYVRRVYEQKLKNVDRRIADLRAQGKGKLADELASVRANMVQVLTGDRAYARLRQLAERMNLSAEVRRELGEITEAAPRLWFGQGVIARIWPRMQLFHELSQDARLVSEAHRPGWVRMPTQRSADMLEQAAKLADKGKLSEALALMEEAQHSGWGALSGKWVAPVLHDALIPKPLDPRSAGRMWEWFRSLAAPVVEAERPTGIWAVEAKALGQLKRWWVPWTAAGQGRNVMGNMIAMHAYGGVPLPLIPYFYLKGFLEVARDGPFFERMARQMSSLAEPAIHTDFQVALAALRKTMRGARVQDSLWRKVRNFPYRFFSLNEAAAKTGVAMYHTWRGLPSRVTSQVAEAAIFHYGDVCRLIEKLRVYGPIPFPTYWWKNVAMFPKTLAEHPERIGTWTRLTQAPGRLRPEEERAALEKLLPEYERVGLPLPIPGTDPQGRIRWYRAGYVLPWGSLIGEAGILGLMGPASEVSTGRVFPVVDPLLDLFRNQSWTGTPIWQERDTTQQRARKIGWHLISSYAPQGWLARAAAEAIGEKRRVGRGGFPKGPTERKPMTASQLLGRGLGISLYVQDLPVEVQRRRRKLNRMQSNITSWLQEEIKREGRLTPAAKAECQKRLEELGAEAEEFARILAILQPRLVVPAEATEARPVRPQAEREDENLFAGVPL